jgi:hypothetical protein
MVMVAPRSPATSRTAHTHTSLLLLVICGPDTSAGTVGPELATVNVFTPDDCCPAISSTSPRLRSRRHRP